MFSVQKISLVSVAFYSYNYCEGWSIGRAKNKIKKFLKKDRLLYNNGLCRYKLSTQGVGWGQTIVREYK